MTKQRSRTITDHRGAPPSVLALAAAVLTVGLGLGQTLLAETHIQRSREIRIDKNSIDQMLETAADASDLRTLTLSLFSDTQLQIARVASKRNQFGSVTLTGELEGDDSGVARLVIDDRGIFGTVQSSFGLFNISPAPNRKDGTHLIEQIIPRPTTCGVGDDIDVLPSTGNGNGPTVSIDANGGDIDWIIQTPPFPVVEVLVVYTPRAIQFIMDEKGYFSPAWAITDLKSSFALLEDATNRSLINSNARVRVRILGLTEIEYTEAWLRLGAPSIAEDLGSFRGLEQVRQLRDVYGADIVTMVSDTRNTVPDMPPWRYYAGRSDFPNHPNNAPDSESGFNVVDVRYAKPHDLTFTHELGHNLAAQHDRHVEFSTAVFSDARGYVDPDFSWRTVMSYSDHCVDRFDRAPDCTTIEAFSNPYETWIDGRALGQERYSNNAVAVVLLAPIVANYRQIVQRDDVYEDNDDISSAYSLANYEGWELSSIAGTGVAWDRDCYSVSVPANRRRLRVAATYANVGGRLGFVLYDPLDRPVAGRSDLEAEVYWNHDLESGFSAVVDPGINTICVIPIDTTGNTYSLRWWTDVTPDAPDLAIVDSPNIGTSTVAPGDQIHARFTVANVGQHTSGDGTLVRLYRSNHPETDSWEGGDELVVQAIPALQPGESIELTLPALWPTVGPAVHWLGACVDQTSAAEFELDNNCSGATPVRQAQLLGTCHYWNWGLSGDPPIVDGTTNVWTLEVIAPNATVADVNLFIEGDHSNLGDLDFRLVGPNQSEVAILGNTCPGWSTEFAFTFDGEATNAYESWSCPPLYGTYLPQGNLPDLYGVPAEGTWRLEVTDTAGGGLGTLWDWTMRICLDSTGTFTPADATECAVDEDGDGYGDCSDCDDSAPTVWSIPGEVLDLRFTGSETLQWIESPNVGGQVGEIQYDVLRSTAAGDFAAAVCVETNDGTDQQAIVTATPLANEVYFFLVRAENDCGIGTIGGDAERQERNGVECL